MLVITRRLDEMLTIGDDITVTIVGIDGRGVRLGIEAPQDVVVLREELLAPTDPRRRRGPGRPGGEGGNGR